MSEQPRSAPGAEREHTFLYGLARVVAVTYSDVFRKVRFTGRERLRSLKGPAIILANHRSMADVFPIGSSSPYEIRFLGKRELAAGKLGAFLFRHLHMIPVSRHETDMSAMRACVKALKEGDMLCIFPEGTRCPDTLMEHVETGAALIALRSAAPLIPVYINSKPRLFRRTRMRVGQMIEYGDLRAEGISSETAEKLTERIRETFFRLRDEDEKENSRGKQG